MWSLLRSICTPISAPWLLGPYSVSTSGDGFIPFVPLVWHICLQIGVPPYMCPLCTLIYTPFRTPYIPARLHFYQPFGPILPSSRLYPPTRLTQAHYCHIWTHYRKYHLPPRHMAQTGISRILTPASPYPQNDPSGQTPKTRPPRAPKPPGKWA